MRIKKGFTLVELSLSLVFISTLALMIVIIISNVISSYRRALTISRVNSTGQALVDEFRDAAGGNIANEIATAESREGGSLSSRDWVTQIKGARQASVSLTDGGGNVGTVDIAGVYCTGIYSFIWNSGYLMNSSLYTVNGGSKLSVRYNGKTYDDIHLLRVDDVTRSACKNFDNLNGSNTLEISGSGTPVDLLSENADGTNLAIYNLTIADPVIDQMSRQTFYSGSFILGTIDGGVNIKSSGDYCKTPNSWANEMFDYCGINRFNFAIRAVS